MTEKTFRDMLPLTDEQRKTLKKNTICYNCFLDCRNNGTGKMCHHFVETHSYGCDKTKAEALRIDAEYREKIMKNDILSQEKFIEYITSIGVSKNQMEFCCNIIKNSHAAALNRIKELEELFNDQAICAEEFATAMAENTMLKFSDERNQKRIAELEKEINALRTVVIDRETDILKLEKENTEYNDKVDDIESRISDYETVQIDTVDEARKKAIDACKVDIPNTTLSCDDIDSCFIVRY